MDSREKKLLLSYKSVFGSDVIYYRSIKRPFTEQDVIIGTYECEYDFN